MTAMTRYALYASMSAFLFTGGWALAFSSDESFGQLLNHRGLGIKQHDIECRDLPDQQTVTKILQRNQDTVQKIQSVGRGNILVSVGDVQGRCPGKADILIIYRSFSEGLKIEKTIGGNELLGIPYTLWRI